jgi:hypothetical protein
MKSTLCSILALTTLLTSGAVHAQTSGASAPTTGAAKENEKEKLLRLLDDLQSFSPLVPNEPSFLVVLGQVQEQLAVAEDSALAPLREFEPHFSHLEATLARMRARLKPVQNAAELCDPARGGDRSCFSGHADVEGQREDREDLQARVARRSDRGPAQVCVARATSRFSSRGPCTKSSSSAIPRSTARAPAAPTSASISSVPTSQA